MQFSLGFPGNSWEFALCEAENARSWQGSGPHLPGCVYALPVSTVVEPAGGTPCWSQPQACFSMTTGGCAPEAAPLAATVLPTGLPSFGEQTQPQARRMSLQHHHPNDPLAFPSPLFQVDSAAFLATAVAAEAAAGEQLRAIETGIALAACARFGAGVVEGACCAPYPSGAYVVAPPTPQRGGCCQTWGCHSASSTVAAGLSCGELTASSRVIHGSSAFAAQPYPSSASNPVIDAIQVWPTQDSLTSAQSAPGAASSSTSSYCHDAPSMAEATAQTKAQAKAQEKVQLGKPRHWPSERRRRRCTKHVPPRLWCSFYLHMQHPGLGFDVVPILIGRNGCNTSRIARETKTKVRVRGRGSGHREHGTNKEAPAPLMLVVAAEAGNRAGFSSAVKLSLELLSYVEERFRKHCACVCPGNAASMGNAPAFTLGPLTVEVLPILEEFREALPPRHPTVVADA
eukprot:TRINITY_DN29179_c0_g1_i1.p1 TRINITY_DN29179_c0_g1~~TRINITY_DN29179_c0_g1_i1.p1  ORF type:complete len:457 (+),score=63.88 TRINITY_DN29179_c0_g1_i1:175-1545(+)